MFGMWVLLLWVQDFEASMNEHQLDELSGDVFALTDLLDYQTGAIVSRTLIDEESATVTLFAVDEGQTISEHTAPHDAIMQVLDGTASVTVGDANHEVTAGESLVFQADEPHALEGQESFKMLLTMVR